MVGGKTQEKRKHQALVAHAYNPSYSGSRDQEDRSSKPAWAKSSEDPISKNLSQKRAVGVAIGVGPEFKLQYWKKKKKKPTILIFPNIPYREKVN
jgi:hypothetical protein